MQMRTDYISKVHYEKNIAYNDENFKQQRTRKMQMRKDYIPKVNTLQRRKFQTNDAKSDCKRERIIFQKCTAKKILPTTTKVSNQ